MDIGGLFVRRFLRLRVEVCNYCKKRPACQKHHQFPKKEWALDLYGEKLLDDPRNCKPSCAECNVSHAGLNIIIWTEIDFVVNLGLGEPRSKEGKIVWGRMKRGGQV